MAKLSAKQREVLERMAKGEPLHYVGWLEFPFGRYSGSQRDYFYELPYNPVREPRFYVSRREIEDMQRKGLLDGQLLSDAGRRVLAESRHD